MDTNRDGVISRAEYDAALAPAPAPRSRSYDYGGWADAPAAAILRAAPIELRREDAEEWAQLALSPAAPGSSRRGAGLSQVLIPHHETFSTTTQPPYSSTKGGIIY